METTILKPPLQEQGCLDQAFPERGWKRLAVAKHVEVACGASGSGFPREGMETSRDQVTQRLLFCEGLDQAFPERGWKLT